MFLTSNAVRALEEAELRAWDWSATTILYISFAWDPAADAAQALSGRRLVKALLAAGARVHVLATNRAADECPSDHYDVTVVPAPAASRRKLWRALRMMHSTIPEVEGEWVAPAVASGVRLLSSMPPETIIYSRAMPGSSNIVAWHLARLTGRPWVAHFSDEWPSTQVFAGDRAWLAAYKRPLFRLWRRRIVRDAGALTFTNPGQGREFLRGFSPRHLEKAFVVTHLPTHHERHVPPPQYELFHIVHTGNFYPPSHTSAALLQGLRLFLDRTPAARGKVRFTQAGWANGDVPAWTARCGLHGVVRLAGRLDQQQVDSLMDAASLLVGIDYARPNSNTLLSKLPDYVTARRPILAITAPSSSMGRLFEEDGAGLTAHYDDPAEVATRIAAVFEEWQQRRIESLLPARTATESFMPRHVLGELAGAFAVARRRVDGVRHPRASRQTNAEGIGMPATGSVHVCFTPCDELNPYQRALRAELGRLGVRVLPRLSLRGLVVRVARGVERLDIVHLHWLPTVQFRTRPMLQLLVFLLRVRLLKALGCRVVWTVHNLQHHEATHRRAERWLARRIANAAAQIIVHSKAAATLVADALTHGDSRKLVVVPHGSYVGLYRNTVSASQARTRLRLDADSPVLLFFGNIRPYKGVPDLIAAYQHAGTARSTLMIVGKADDAMRASVERSIAGSPGIRLIAGFVRDDDVQDYMNASDVVVFPYREVLTSGAIVLAMSFGRACIAPAVGSIPELLDEQGAFLYDPAERDGLRRAIDRAIANQARLVEMGAHNRRRAAEWGWDRVARQTAAVYAMALHPSTTREGDRAADALPLPERIW